MNNEHNNASGGGVGFLGLLTIVFIALKLAGIIDWPWVWVLAPLWIPVVIIFVAAVIIVTVKEVIKASKKR